MLVILSMRDITVSDQHLHDTFTRNLMSFSQSIYNYEKTKFHLSFEINLNICYSSQPITEILKIYSITMLISTHIS